MPGYEVIGKEEQDEINKLFELNGGVLMAHGFDAKRNHVYRVREFEQAICNLTQAKYALAVTSCTAALRVGLAAINLPKDAEVILPAFTFVATAEAIIEAGGIPVFAEIDETLNICPDSVKSCITEKTAAIIPVHMMGQTANMQALLELADEHELKIVEDAAWGLSSYYQDKHLGTIGDVGCFSFDAGKIISTGEGGMLVTNSAEIFETARSFHDHGHAYDSTRARGVDGIIGRGFNFRMTELQACVGLAQLKKLPNIVSQHAKTYQLIDSKLRNMSDNFKIRACLSEEHNSDSLTITFTKPSIAKAFLIEFNKMGYGTKNLPDAMQWHFAKNWGYILETYQASQKVCPSFPKSTQLLTSSICIPISYYDDEPKVNKMCADISHIVEHLA